MFRTVERVLKSFLCREHEMVAAPVARLAVLVILW